MSNGNNPGRFQHYLGGALVLMVEHPDAATKRDVDAVLQQVNREGGTTTLRTPRAAVPYPRVGNKRACSLVLVDVNDDDEHHEALVPHLRKLNDIANNWPRNTGAPRLYTASPNWLASSTPLVVWGGSGGRPAPAPTVGPKDHLFTLPPDLNLQRPHEKRGTGVDVVVLDTVLSREALAGAYTTWHGTHPLIKSLLHRNGPLHITHAADGTLPPQDYQLASDLYPMPDHGLFGAGIVHSIAPAASIQLVETLNAQGVGTMARLVEVLSSFIDRPNRHKPLVINCSLVINLPQPSLRQALMERKFAWSGLDPALMEGMDEPLQRVCEVLRSQGVLVVAAAGNDTLNNEYYFVDRGPARPRYPAAFPSVLGVAALDGNMLPAVYSNAADDPHSDGIATFGGAADAQHVVLPEQGMLGVYTGTFPNNEASTNGWAWWAGTSFAAPVVTGMLAALLSENPDPNAALAKVKQIAQASSPTPVGPPVPVTQG